MPLVAKSAGSARPLASSRARALEDISMGELNKRDELDGILTLQQVLDEEEEIHAESPFGKENIRPGAESRSSDHLESPSRRHSKTLSIDPQSSSHNAEPPFVRSTSSLKIAPVHSEPVSETARPTSSTYSIPHNIKPSDSVTRDRKNNFAQFRPAERINPYYHRHVGENEVSIRVPSCNSLPANWTIAHDRLIAYMATHAPLTKDGKIPAHEESRERWTTKQMIDMLKERFPKLRGTKLRAYGIEKRLMWLDDAYSKNDYFRMQYGAYQVEEWGRGI